ncbi:MAG: hypothetical protein CL902_11210 [Dehalococcoidia bacterium]|nr:hypothetical protein [Dehalococcoidia bacterium]|tara:strand:- start:2 stop:397 length:396 start_codon:yes stop_codon:yes gene_type:complete
MEADQFTLEEANALVPWLQEKFLELKLRRQQYLAAQKRFDEIVHDPTKDGSTPDLELAEVAASVKNLAAQVEDRVQEILDRGIILRDVSSGLVDFPSQRDGREVFLCWIGGEEEIRFWHETNFGFEHRQPL